MVARKVHKADSARSLRPVVGGTVLACVVLAGLTVFLTVGQDYEHDRADTPYQVAIFIFNRALLLDEDAEALMPFHVVAAAIAMAGALCAVGRREWGLAWVGSLFGLAFGPLALIGIYLIGTSDLHFRSDRLLRKLRSLIGARSARRDPFAGVVAVVLVAFILGGTVTVFYAIMGSYQVAFAIQVLFLLAVFWVVTVVSTMVREVRNKRSKRTQGPRWV